MHYELHNEKGIERKDMKASIQCAMVCHYERKEGILPCLTA